MMSSEFILENVEPKLGLNDLTYFVSFFHWKMTVVCTYFVGVCNHENNAPVKTSTAKKHRPVAMLLRTGLINVVMPTLFKVVNNIDQHCYTPFSLNNVVQCCWQLCTIWPAQHGQGYFRSVRAPSYQDYQWIFLGD